MVQKNASSKDSPYLRPTTKGKNTDSSFLRIDLLSKVKLLKGNLISGKSNLFLAIPLLIYNRPILSAWFIVYYIFTSCQKVKICQAIDSFLKRKQFFVKI